MAIQWIKCGQCGTENSLPSRSTEIACESCGSMIERPAPTPAAARPATGRRPAAPPVASRSAVPIVTSLAALVLLGAGAWFAFRPKADPVPHEPTNQGTSASSLKTAATTRATPESIPPEGTPTAPPPKADDPAPRIAEIRNSMGGSGADHHWAIARKLHAEAEAWKARGAPEAAWKAIESAAQDAAVDTLREAPDHAEARALHGDLKVQPILDEFDDRDARLLSSKEEKLLVDDLERIGRLAQQSHGWVSQARFDQVCGPLIKKATERRHANDVYFATDLGAKARREEIEKRAVLDRFAKNHAHWRAVHLEPYVILIEQSPKWDEQAKAEEIAGHLRGLAGAFMKEFGAPLGLALPKKPINVACFVDRQAFQEYLAGRSGGDAAPPPPDPGPGGKPGAESKPEGTSYVEAHFEPSNNMLVIHGDCAMGTILHEGTHQLVHALTPKPLPPHADSFWFQEGIAEWFGGARLGKDAAGKTTYEVGLLQEDDFQDTGHMGRLTMLAVVPDKDRFTLESLVAQRWSDKSEYEKQGPAGDQKILMVYAQGWFFVYFLTHFDVDDRGIVKFGGKGKYYDGWARYLKAELDGKWDQHLFANSLGLDAAGMRRMQDELNAYLSWIIRKLGKGHFKSQRILPWSAIPAGPGHPAATEEDDRLIPKK